LEANSVLVILDSGKEASFKKHEWEIKNYKLSGNEIEERVTGKISQIPLKLSWAMTIHKSQGQTLEKAFIDLSYKPWESGHSYVAFSRVKSLEGIKLKIPLKKEDIIVDQRILEWENNLKREKPIESFQFQEMNISGLDYLESEELVRKINEELYLDWSIKEKMVLLESQISFLIIQNPLLFGLIVLRIKKLLRKIVQEKKIIIFVNKGEWNEEIFSYKRSEKEKMNEILGLFGR